MNFVLMADISGCRHYVLNMLLHIVVMHK